jgi:predicted HD phosphohydrolase
MADTAEWNVVVSRQTDQAVREFLADEAAGQARDLSSFVEDAVRARLFEPSVARARQRTAHLNPNEIEALVDEAVAWARHP